MLKGDTVRLQPWFIIRIMILLVAYTNEGHKDYKGDWLHRGLLHCFWRQEISAWNLVFISPGGQFGHRYVIPTATRHIVQSSLKQQDGVSFFFQDGVGLACSFPPSSSPPALERWSPNHWTAREVPEISHILYFGTNPNHLKENEKEEKKTGRMGGRKQRRK